jgi:hypothetical protein
MPEQFIATLRRTVEDHVRVTVPPGVEIERLFGEVYVTSPTQAHVSLSLEVAAREGLVIVERL